MNPVDREESKLKKLKTEALSTSLVLASEPSFIEENPPNKKSLLVKRSLSLFKRNINKALYNHYIVNSNELQRPAHLHPVVESEFPDQNSKSKG